MPGQGKPWHEKPAERSVRSVHRERYGPQERPHRSVAISPDSDEKVEGDGVLVPEANKKEPLW